MLLMSRIRAAAREADHLSFTYGGGDTSELVALVSQIADREHCTINYTVVRSAYSGDRGQQFQAIVGTNSTASWAGFMPMG
jgi:hypothetical protein